MEILCDEVTRIGIPYGRCLTCVYVIYMYMFVYNTRTDVHSDRNRFIYTWSGDTNRLLDSLTQGQTLYTLRQNGARYMSFFFVSLVLLWYSLCKILLFSMTLMILLYDLYFILYSDSIASEENLYFIFRHHMSLNRTLIHL